MKPFCLRTTCLVAVILLVNACPLFAQVNLVQRSSFLNATDFNFDPVTGNFVDPMSEGFFFDEFGTFNEIAMVPDVEVRQNSTVTELLFSIEAFASGGPKIISGDIEAFSLFSVDFDVITATSYLFEGSLESENPIDNNDNETIVRLLDRNATGDSATLIRFDSEANSTFDFNSTGVLQPGEYTFEFDSRSFGYDSVLTSDVSLSFASVPEPSSFALILGASLAVSTRRRRAIKL